MATIGNRIKQRRIKLGLSVDELAKRLNKNRATVYRYENDEIENMPVGIINSLSKILDTTPTFIMGWEDDDSANNPAIKKGGVAMKTHEFIKYLRERRGMSQDMLAEQAGYKDRSSIAKIESGKVDLSESKIEALATALGTTKAVLLGMYSDIGNIIRNKRMSADMTPSALASMLNTTEETVVEMEMGIIKPTISQVKALQQILNIDPYSITDFDTASLMLTEDMNSWDPEYELTMQHIKRINDTLIKLNEKGLITAAEYIEYLASKTEYQYGE